MGFFFVQKHSKSFLRVSDAFPHPPHTCCCLQLTKESPNLLLTLLVFNHPATVQ